MQIKVVCVSKQTRYTSINDTHTFLCPSLPSVGFSYRVTLVFLENNDHMVISYIAVLSGITLELYVNHTPAVLPGKSTLKWYF